MSAMKAHILRNAAAALMLLALLVVSCRKDEDYRTGHDSAYDENPLRPRRSDPITRKVLLVYSAGFNSLSGYLREDIQDLCEGSFIPGNRVSAPVLLVFSRQPVASGQYGTPTAPALFRIYRDIYGEVIRDTLHVPGLTENTVASSGETLNRVLSFVRDRYPGSRYGMVFSSHASGWLPPGYFSNPESYDGEGGGIWNVGRRSIGQDVGVDASIEMSLGEFRDALPMHLDYLLFDACLMGTVEVAYELREKADTIGFSQTEILAEGFDYTRMAWNLLSDEGSGALGVCRDYFEQYNQRSGRDRSATISVVDCHQMEALAQACAPLFERHYDAIHSLSGRTVQPYFRYDKHWFYDLEDILTQAGMTDAEKAELEAALERALPYRAATPVFLSIPIERYCGLSMFLPSPQSSSDFLRNYYKENIAWNTATGLVH